MIYATFTAAGGSVPVLRRRSVIRRRPVRMNMSLPDMMSEIWKGVVWPYLKETAGQFPKIIVDEGLKMGAKGVISGGTSQLAQLFKKKEEKAVVEEEVKKLPIEQCVALIVLAWELKKLFDNEIAVGGGGGGEEEKGGGEEEGSGAD